MITEKMRGQNLVRPKKNLGQHFLNDLSIARATVDALETDCANVLEIGPGMGVLTQFLLEKNYNLHVIEIDSESVRYLLKKFPQLNERIINSDFLHTDLTNYFAGPYAVIGNFPYNISSQILFKILEHKNSVPMLVGMFQHEVAQRIAAVNGNRNYGILSVLTQTFYNVEYLFKIDEHVFTPPPKVKSAVIRLIRKPNVSLNVPEQQLADVVKTAFNQRRKMLRNALHKYSGHPNFDSLKILNLRAEQLSVEQFHELAFALS